jgi:N-methylhydantoinase A
LSLVAFGGMGAVHATTQAALLGMRQVLVPRGAAGLSAAGLLSADHVVDDQRGHVTPWREADLSVLTALADELRAGATEELRTAGVPDERMRFNWSLLLVYPGQTFDVPIPVDDPFDVEGAVTEFHRRNEEARLIEARAQEPILRGVRLTAVGEVDKPATPAVPPAATSLEPIARRDIWLEGEWRRDAPVYDEAAMAPGSAVTGPAAVQGPFTTVILRPGDRAEATAAGDLLIDVAPLVTA